MNDRTFQNNVRQALDQSANRIDQATLVKLREARSKAIEQFDARQAVPEFSWAGLSTKFGFAPALTAICITGWPPSFLWRLC